MVLTTLFTGVITSSTFTEEETEAQSSPITCPRQLLCDRSRFCIEMSLCSNLLLCRPAFWDVPNGDWLFLKCQVNKALGNCLAVTGTSQERLLNRNRDSQTAASWSNGLPFLGLASTSFTWIKFESGAMFLLDPGSDLEYRKHLAIYRCHKFLWCAVKSWGCCQAGVYQYGPKVLTASQSQSVHWLYFHKSSKNKFKQI